MGDGTFLLFLGGICAEAGAHHPNVVIVDAGELLPGGGVRLGYVQPASKEGKSSRLPETHANTQDISTGLITPKTPF